MYSKFETWRTDDAENGEMAPKTIGVRIPHPLRKDEPHLFLGGETRPFDGTLDQAIRKARHLADCPRDEYEASRSAHLKF